MKKIALFLIGIIVGASGMLFLYKQADENNKYVQLMKDYKIGDIGILKRGTILRIDEPMSEGFTRYILYLNLKDGRLEVHEPLTSDEIIPYWLYDMIDSNSSIPR